jgi:hypothetical protein
MKHVPVTYRSALLLTYGDTCNYFQGEGKDMYGQDFATLNFDLSSQGLGTRGFTDSIDADLAPDSFGNTRPTAFSSLTIYERDLQT